MNEFFNPKVGLRALFTSPHWLAPYHNSNMVDVMHIIVYQCNHMAKNSRKRTMLLKMPQCVIT